MQRVRCNAESMVYCREYGVVQRVVCNAVNSTQLNCSRDCTVQSAEFRVQSTECSSE